MLNRILDRVMQACGLVAVTAIALMALTITVDVTIRTLGFGTLRGGLEAVEYMVFAAAFLAAPWVLHMNAHVRVDFLVQSLPKRLATVVESAADLLGLGVCGVVFWFAARIGLQSMAEGRLVYKTFIFPEWWLYAVICFCMTLLVIEFIRRLVRALRGQPLVETAAPGF